MWRNGVISRLPLPANADSAEADGINSLDHIVGFAIAGSASYAVLWQQGVVYNLNALIQSDGPNQPSVFLNSAYLINNRGQIIGDAYDPSTGAIASYLLSLQN